MKINLYKAMLGIILFIAILMTIVSAMEVTDVNLNFDTADLEIIGITDNLEAQDLVTLQIVKSKLINPDEGLTKGDLKNLEMKGQFKEAIVYFDQMTSGEGGKFGFQYDLYEIGLDEGEYYIRLKSNNEDNISWNKVVIFNPIDVTKEFGKLNGLVGSEENKESIYDILKINSAMFIQNDVFFDAVLKNDKSIKNIAEMLTCHESFTDLNSLNIAMKQFAALEYLNRADDVGMALKNQEIVNILMLDTQLHLQYLNLPVNKQKKLEEKIAKRLENNFRDYVTLTQIMQAFKAALMIDELESGNGSDYVGSIIKKHANLFDLTNYNSSSNTQEKINRKIADAVSECKINTMADIQSLLNTSENSGSTVGGNTGGGGNHDSAVNITAPLKNDIKPTVYEIFDDLIGFEWAKESIEELSKMGIVSGYGEKKFKPQQAVTRNEYLKLLIDAMKTTDSSATCSFSDVEAGSWEYKYVATAQQMGIVTGDEKNNFNGNEKITREDIAVITCRAIYGADKDIHEEAPYTDMESVSKYAKIAVSKMNTLGLMIGDNGMFNPIMKANRAEAATLIYRLVKGEINGNE